MSRLQRADVHLAPDRDRVLVQRDAMAQEVDIADAQRRCLTPPQTFSRVL